ncbi:MAG: cation transporter [Methanomassiliicoccales archaeon]|nr:MAG: cation transporter [Methanomassiliicoccales archaeon]
MLTSRKKGEPLQNTCGQESGKKLKLAIVLTSAILIAEVIGGIISNSLALLTDAAHVFMDTLALGLSLSAITIACRPLDDKATFGYHRAEIFAALINALLLVIVVIFILMEAKERLVSQPEIRTFEMLVVASIGLVVNLFVTLTLRGHHDLNIRGAYLHVLGDTLSSSAVIVGGVLIIITGNYIIDPILSIIISCFIVYSSLRLLKESVDVLMESTPKHIDIEKLKKDILEVEGIHGIHDLHVWSICSNVHALNAHLLVDSISVKDTEKITSKINKRLLDGFKISHTTLQFECNECGISGISDSEHMK